MTRMIELSDTIVAQFSVRVFVTMRNPSALRHFPFVTSCRLFNLSTHKLQSLTIDIAI
jgi:hypothetical protein